MGITTTTQTIPCTTMLWAPRDCKPRCQKTWRAVCRRPRRRWKSQRLLISMQMLWIARVFKMLFSVRSQARASNVCYHVWIKSHRHLYTQHPHPLPHTGNLRPGVPNDYLFTSGPADVLKYVKCLLGYGRPKMDKARFFPSLSLSRFNIVCFFIYIFTLTCIYMYYFTPRKWLTRFPSFASCDASWRAPSGRTPPSGRCSSPRLRLRWRACPWLGSN